MFQIDAYSIQAALHAQGLYSKAIDGIIGKGTRDGIALALEKALPTQAWKVWPVGRQSIAYQQLMMKGLGIEVGEIDGLVGPQTLFAFEQWQNKVRDITPSKEQVAHQPAVWPRQADVPSYYGEVGTHQRQLSIPYPMRLAWDMTQTINHISVHEKVFESATRIFANVLSAYGLSGIQGLRLDRFGGSLNVRKMRGGSNWSMHSWGIAMDWDPERNQLRMGRNQATLDSPDYDKWWAIWEAEGWISLGRERNYDWMHVQAARL